MNSETCPPVPKFSGVSMEELLVIEVCAGSARLTKTCRKLGLRGLAVDKVTERSCGIDIMVLDLTVASQLQLLLDIIEAEKHRILMIFIAPPCGTASRARGRPIKSSLLRGRKAPAPLRSDLQPDGLDNLEGLDKLKTELANQLYEGITQLILFVASLDICVVVENPTNSLYWKTSFAQKFLTMLGGCMTDFHNCCHGGSRDKLTSLWSNKEWMQPLQMFCDGQHPHQSWRPKIRDGRLVFSYSRRSSLSLASLYYNNQLGLGRGSTPGGDHAHHLEEQMTDKDFSLMNRYIFEALPRSTKLRPLVPEFSHYAYVVTPAQHVDLCTQVLKLFPKGAKILPRRLSTWGVFRAEQFRGECVFLEISEVDISKDQTVECHHVGVPHDPMAFLEKAIDAGHPKDLERHVDPTMHEVLMDNFHRPPHLLARRRIDFIKKYTQLAKTSKAEELKLRLKMPAHIRKLMTGKRLHLLGAMLTDLGFPDKDLLHDLCNGFKLSGWMPDSNLFPRKVRNPTLTVDALKQSSNSFNEKVMQQMSIRQESVLEQDTWSETEHEIEQDWIWEDTTSDWSGKSVARRFGIRQGGKTRVIDDCTVCGLNLTVGTKEKFSLHTIDQLCGMLDHSFTCSKGQHCRVLGRTYDLKSAYKQFGLCSHDRDFVRIAVNKPGAKDPVLLGLNALPFGAIGSVAGFLRISFAIWWIGVFGMGVAWSAYFDDYSSLTRPELASNTHWAISSLFELIGLQYAKDGSKAPPFNDVFRMLGLMVNMVEAPSLRFSVGHTDERITELKQCLRDIISNGQLSTKEAERVRGRMIFFECYVFGRIANLDLKEFGNLCRLGRTSCVLDECENFVVQKLLARLDSAKPVSLGINNLSTWLIFTDGACEDGSTTGSIGGVLIAPNHRVVHHFGCNATTEVMRHLLLASKHPIHELDDSCPSLF